jgi:hypothetical protein
MRFSLLNAIALLPLFQTAFSSPIDTSEQQNSDISDAMAIEAPWQPDVDHLKPRAGPFVCLPGFPGRGILPVRTNDQIDINYILALQTERTFYRRGGDARVDINAETYDLDRRIVLYMENTDHIHGNAALFTFYAGTTNRGPALARMRFEVAVDGHFNVCPQFNTPVDAHGRPIVGHWWFQFER